MCMTQFLICIILKIDLCYRGFLGAIGVIVVLSTVYDLIMRYLEKSKWYLFFLIELY